jgi:hypothetical protein
MGRNIKDETGNKYGMLSVIEFHGRDNKGHALWVCKCLCGVKSIVRGYSLRSGNTMSCGCKSIEKENYTTPDSALVNYEKDKKDKKNFNNTLCPICGFHRTDKRHTKKCSQIMQKRVKA